MGTAASELAGEGCLGKADPEEPVFVLRAQDEFAPMLVKMWCELVVKKNPDFRKTEKYKEAAAIYKGMEKWQLYVACKVPD